MAEHIAILQRGVAFWNHWREDNPGIVPDLLKADLREMDLAHANLSSCRLGGANLRKAVLRQADLRKAHLGGAHLGKAIFRGADLEGAYLGGAQMRGAIFRGCNLHSANLEGANARGANLRGVNLRNSTLYQGTFAGADLRGADLGAADLRRTDFREAHLGKAKFYNAQMGYTILALAILKDVSGLETVEHRGPSVLGVETLSHTHSTLPENFLRGIGVPESLLEYLPSLTASALNYYSCFISYSHHDKSFARRLHDQLQGRGIRCWLDEHQMLPGDDIYNQVDQGIRLWDKVLLCCSEASLASGWVDHEIDAAFEKERQRMKSQGEKVLVLIPLNLDGFLFSGHWRSGKAQQVKTRLAADFTGWEHDNEKFESQFVRVVQALRADEAAREPAPTPKL